MCPCACFSRSFLFLAELGQCVGGGLGFCLPEVSEYVPLALLERRRKKQRWRPGKQFSVVRVGPQMHRPSPGLRRRRVAYLHLSAWHPWLVDSNPTCFIAALVWVSRFKERRGSLLDARSSGFVQPS